MKRNVLALLAAVGCTTGTAMAVDWNPSPFTGPYEVYPVVGDVSFKSLDLVATAAPAGTYNFVTVTADWNRTVASLQWQNDSRMSLTDTAITGTSTLSGTIYYGGVNGTVPTTATGNNTPGTIRWDYRQLSPAFTADGVNNLFFEYRTNYTGGTAGIQWSNITVSMTDVIAPPVNETCATAIDVSAAANAALTAVNTQYAAPSALIIGAQASVSSPFSCQATVGRATWIKFQPAVTRPYTIGSCTANAPQNTMALNVVGVFEAATGGDPCAGLTQVACSTTACTGGVSTLVTLDSTKTYYICLARTGTTALGGAEARSQIFIQVPDAAVCGANTETEPNDTFALANNFALSVGDTICGTSTGTGTSGGGLATYDYHIVKTPAHAGIKRNRARIASATAGHSASLYGLTQNTGGVTGTTESALQTAVTTTTPARMLQWYTLGNDASADDRKVVVRVGGATATTQPYAVSYYESVAIVPMELSRTLKPGSISITTRGQTGGTQNDTDLWVYDSNFNPIVGYGNDDSKVDVNSLGSDVTRTLAAGTYYMAISNYNIANNMNSSQSDEDFQTGALARFPGVISHGTGTVATNFNSGCKFTDIDGEVPLAITLNAGGTDPWEVAFVKFVVADDTPVNQRCQPADIACDDGTALPADTNIHPNGGVNEGDYNSFFQGFFDAAANCDIANDDATPLPPFGTLTSNGGVNEGDYNCFFQKFFDGCPV